MDVQKIGIGIFVFLLHSYAMFGQNKNVQTYSYPPIQNYSDQEYDSYIQNWDIAQDTSGIIYVANVGEVLEYDGVRWQAIQIENNRALSIRRGSDNKIFVGGVGSFGYLEKPPADTSIALKYHSLVPAIPDSGSKILNIWNVITHKGATFFDGGEALYNEKNDAINIYKPKNAFRRSFKVRDEIILSDTGEGLYTVENNSLVPVPNSNQFIDRDVNAMLPHGDDSWLVADRTEGLSVFDGTHLIPLESTVDGFLVNNKVYTGIQLPDDSYLFGTLNGGIVQVDQAGRLLRKIDSESGLASDQVHSLFLDQANNVWVALGNGLSVIEPMNPISYLDERSGLPGTVIDLTVFRNDLYAATNEGLFRLDIKQKKSSASPNTQFEPLFDQSIRCNSITQYGDNLLINCDNSLYQISEGKAVKLFESSSVQFVQAYHRDKNIYLVLGRSRLQVFDASHKLVFSDEEFGYEISSLIEERDGDVWVGTIQSGVFRIESTFFDSLMNFENFLHHYEVPHDQENRSLRVSNISGEAVIGSSAGLYHYDAAGDSLIRDPRFGEEMADPERQIFLMEEDAEGNIWVRSNREHQVLLKEKDRYRFAEAGLKRIDANQVNRIYAHESGLIWMATDDGIIQYDPSKDPYLQGNPPEPFKTHVRGVYVRGDSLINADLKNEGYELEYEDNELRFQYAAAQYKEPSATRYQVWLEGFEEGWSDWTSEVQKDYTNIPEGDYTFHVRARDVYGTVSKADTFSFAVLPPWYRTWWAYALYVLLIGGILYGIHRVRINRILREQRIRNRIASDLHDEVSATLSSITYFAQAIRQVPDEQQADRFVSLISESASEAKEKITDIIWSIDPEKDDWIDLLSKCRRFASDLFESKDIAYELDIDTDIDQPLDLELRQHLWLIFKEMTVNAARHSKADKVKVIFEMEGNLLKLVVQDNGQGIQQSSGKREGKGIKSIRNRAEQIKADLQLETEEKRGTKWTMALRI
ncbi:histidine kinase [Aliifodinibius salicampi]|uniref:histidine kinase n=1 Tax=Fodinibius salicampi TaxID=1920655 RepID=A0ABT3PX04_9BACT|nr:histidine kinase [Fodinibius salicampi]